MNERMNEFFQCFGMVLNYNYGHWLEISLCNSSQLCAIQLIKRSYIKNTKIEKSHTVYTFCCKLQSSL